jgi:uncharacterized damage-inducible protein DinB
MTVEELQKLKYPIGKFQRPTEFPDSFLKECIKEIEIFPARIKSAVANLSDAQLDTPYRPDGWTIRQVVHHCADSHSNAFIRFKLALTEETPTVKPYFEARWAEMPDTKIAEINSSLKIIDGLHSRWTILLKSLSKKDFEKTFFHPEQKREVRLNETLAMYAWHGRHHVGHITSVIDWMNWK